MSLITQAARRTKRVRQPSDPLKMSQGSETKFARTSSSSKMEALVPGERCAFLDLLAEIRNMIYEMVVDKLPEAYLCSRTRSNLACRCALLRVNHQIREEFLAVLYVRASKITDTVQNFDFRHVVTVRIPAGMTFPMIKTSATAYALRF